MREAAFTFSPIRKQLKRAKKIEKDPRLTIGKAGTIIFTPALMAMVGIHPDKGCWIKIYSDPVKRAFGFQIKNEISPSAEKDSSCRRMNIMHAKSGYKFCQTSIASFLNSIGAPKQIYKCEIKTYNDSMFGKMFYIQIPHPLQVAKLNPNER